jgi:hypothetical protein
VSLKEIARGRRLGVTGEGEGDMAIKRRSAGEVWSAKTGNKVELQISDMGPAVTREAVRCQWVV